MFRFMFMLCLVFVSSWSCLVSRFTFRVMLTFISASCSLVLDQVQVLLLEVQVLVIDLIWVHD